MFFHPGYLFREPVTLNEFTSSHQQQIRLAEAYFNYGPLIKKHGDLPPDGGFAGFRLHAPLNNPDYFDELIAFQGASYWRALGKKPALRPFLPRHRRGHRCRWRHGGISRFPRVLAAQTRGRTTPTPASTRCLTARPTPVPIAFKIHPGNDTIVDVKAVHFHPPGGAAARHRADVEHVLVRRKLAPALR